MKRSLMRLLPALLLLVVLAACTNENPSIKVSNTQNQTGGTLVITGSGFIAGNPIAVSIQNAPGLTAPWSEKAGSADINHSINVTVSYSYAPFGKLPGCQTGNSLTTNITVTAADSITHKFAAAPLQVIECEWTVPQVTSHQ